MEQDKNIRECLEVIFDRMKDGEQFSGLELKKWVVQLNSAYEFTYPDTILRTARKFHRNEFKKFKARQSIYVVTK